MPATLVIAELTFREAARRKILLAALVLGLVFLTVYGFGFNFVQRESASSGARFSRPSRRPRLRPLRYRLHRRLDRARRLVHAESDRGERGRRREPHLSRRGPVAPRRAEMQSPLVAALGFSPFTSPSVPSPLLVGYAALYAAVAFARAVREFARRDL